MMDGRTPRKEQKQKQGTDYYFFQTMNFVASTKSRKIWFVCERRISYNAVTRKILKVFFCCSVGWSFKRLADLSYKYYLSNDFIVIIQKNLQKMLTGKKELLKKCVMFIISFLSKKKLWEAFSASLAANIRSSRHAANALLCEV